jgi:hypothetical protein
MKNKKYHTVGTVLKSIEKQKIPLTEQLKNLMKNKKYHTVGTVLKSNEK